MQLSDRNQSQTGISHFPIYVIGFKKYTGGKWTFCDMIMNSGSSFYSCGNMNFLHSNCLIFMASGESTECIKIMSLQKVMKSREGREEGGICRGAGGGMVIFLELTYEMHEICPYINKNSKRKLLSKKNLIIKSKMDFKICILK